MLTRIRQSFSQWLRRRQADEDVARFLAFNRDRWGGHVPADPDAVVLLGLFPLKPSIFCHSHLVNYLARRTGAGIGYYHFRGPRNSTLAKIYESFGARLVLDADLSAEERRDCEETVEEVLRQQPSKEELLRWNVGGIRLGDLAYNTYLRRYEQPTARLDDPRLREVMVETLLTLVEER